MTVAYYGTRRRMQRAGTGLELTGPLLHQVVSQLVSQFDAQLPVLLQLRRQCIFQPLAQPVFSRPRWDVCAIATRGRVGGGDWFAVGAGERMQRLYSALIVCGGRMSVAVAAVAA